MDRALPGGKGVLLAMYDEKAFAADAASAFPELGLEGEVVGVHIQMGALGSAVRAALAREDMAHVLGVMDFLVGVLANPRAISEIENAVAISFVSLDELRATEVGREVLSVMPSKIRDILEAQELGDRG